MSSGIDVERLRSDVAEAILAALAGHERSMLTRWVTVVESIDADSGERGLWCLSPAGSKAWDTVGLLQYALHLEQAATTADAVRRELSGEDE